MISVSIKFREVCNKVSVSERPESIHNNPVIHKTYPGRLSLLTHCPSATSHSSATFFFFFDSASSFII